MIFGLLIWGKNFTGTYKLKIQGKKGDTITFRFGERVYEDGNLNPMTAVTGQIKEKVLVVQDLLMLHGKQAVI